MTILITKATEKDVHRVARMCSDWIEESRVPWPPSITEAMEAWVLRCIENGYVIVATDSGRLYGVAGIVQSFLPWNQEVPILHDQFFYVPRTRATTGERAIRAERRVPGVANALLGALKAYAERRKMPLIMGIISGYETGKLERWYGIQGGQYIGGTLVFPAREAA